MEILAPFYADIVYGNMDNWSEENKAIVEAREAYRQEMFDLMCLPIEKKDG